MIRPWVANLLLLIAALAWITNFVLSVIREDYVINESVNSVFLALITGIIAAKASAMDRPDDEDHDDHRDGDAERPRKDHHDV